MPQMVAVTADLVVEGTDDARAIGAFRGRVIAVAVEDDGSGHPPTAQGTWLLIADENRPAPLWVSQSTVTAQRLGR